MLISSHNTQNHYILIYYKNIPLFWLEFNIKLDGGGRFVYIQYIKGDIARFYMDKWGIEMDLIVKGGKVQFALFKTYLYYVSWFLITIVIVKMKIFYPTIYVPFYTLLIITHHVFFFFFLSL